LISNVLILAAKTTGPSPRKRRDRTGEKRKKEDRVEGG
jgi:hypothetical protein